MSTRIWSMMDVGKRSLMNSQTALQTVSHNIANKSTEGYSRQRVDMETNVPVGNGKLRLGMGARASTVARTNNEFLERQIEKEGNELGYKKVKNHVLTRVEQVYNEQVNKGLNKYMGEFFNAFRELSNNPESLSIRSLVKETADFLAKDFQRVNRQLTKIQGETDYQIKTIVNEVNEYTKEIADLNDKIQLVEMNALEANDERDRRELLLKKLSEKVNIRYAENESGALTVTAGNSAVLVSGNSQVDLIAASVQGKGNKAAGSVDLFYKSTEGGTPINVSNQFKTGELGGLLEVRDQTITGLLDNVDELAFTLAKEVNKAHRFGYDSYSQQGQNFFNFKNNSGRAAERLELNVAIQEDVNKIVAAAAPRSPGDNRVANVISSLQYQNKMGNGSSSFDDYYATLVGEIGIKMNRANNDLSSQEDTMKQLSHIRESVSGVSLDEETAKMIEFQKTYDASARLIRTADEMMETVLNLKRL